MAEGGGVWHTSFRNRSISDYYLTAAELRTLIKKLRRMKKEKAKCPADESQLNSRIAFCEDLLEQDRRGMYRIPAATRNAKVKKLSVIGLGKLGSPMVACLSKAYEVVGVDIDPRKVDAINNLQAPVFEPLLDETLKSRAGKLSATQDIEAAVRDTDVTFIVTATPSEPGGGFSLRYVLPACE